MPRNRRSTQNADPTYNKLIDELYEEFKHIEGINSRDDIDALIYSFSATSVKALKYGYNIRIQYFGVFERRYVVNLKEMYKTAERLKNKRKKMRCIELITFNDLFWKK
jgi:nucleoid DNA-binding protein